MHTNTKLAAILSCVFYATVSVILVIFNKIVFSTFKFQQPVVLFVYQTIFGVIAGVLIGANKGWKWSTARTILPTSLFFVGMAVTGMTALKYVNVPMYSALRKLTTLIVMLGEYLFLKTKHSFLVIVCVTVMTLGAVLAGWNDLHGSLVGYMYTILCCCLTAGYTVTMKRNLNVLEAKESKRLSSMELLFFNMTNALPLVLIGAGSFGLFPSMILSRELSFLLCFFTSVLMAFVLNYATVLCTSINSPLTTSIVGDLKNIVCDVIGILMFPDVTLTVGYASGIFISTLGGIAYSYARYREMKLLEKARLVNAISLNNNSLHNNNNINNNNNNNTAGNDLDDQQKDSKV